MKIGSVVFGGGELTYGMSVVTTELKENLGIDVFVADTRNAREFDILLVSLYWWENIYELVRFYLKAGIDPSNPSPIIMIGGMAAYNPWPILNLGHYIILGDGEGVACDIVRKIANNRLDDIEEIDCVVTKNNINTKIHCARSIKKLMPYKYVETRTNKTTRIEIARGCKFRCPFCLISFVKPYRELDKEVIRSLISTSPTKNIALFAPDKASYSDYSSLLGYIRSFRKRDTGQDIRLDMVYGKENIIASHPRFGIEGFTEKKRKQMGKYPKNERLIEQFVYLLKNGRTQKGKHIKAVTAYMIADLPGERNPRAVKEFFEILKMLDSKVPHKFTLFLTVNSFAPYYFTPMERDGIELYSNFNKWFAESKPHLENITIATHGGLMGPAKRLAQMITIRGDKRSQKLIYFIATDPRGRRAVRMNNEESGKFIEKVIASAGYKAGYFTDAIDPEADVPWGLVNANRQTEAEGQGR